MSNIKRVIGGAGSGKSRLILAEMDKARHELGLSPCEIGFTTFTTNGRRVIVERAAAQWGCDGDYLAKEGNFRTAHSTCMRQIKVTSAQLLASDEESAGWIAQHIGTDLDIPAKKASSESTTYCSRSRESREAAMALSFWSFSRNTLTPLIQVIEMARSLGQPAPSLDAAKHFIERYESAKRMHERLDFCDLLGQFAGVSFSIEGHTPATPKGDPPEEIRALFIDEAQDASALVDRVCRRLATAPGVDRALIVGDSFQAIFGFTGSDYRNFESWEAEQSVMPRSYRCPRPIMELGERCLATMHAGYWDRGIAPAAHEGFIEQAFQPDDAIDQIDLEESTLILARCHFSLKAFAKTLAAREIPFESLEESHQKERDAFHALWKLQHNEAVLHDAMQAAIALFPAQNGDFLERGTKEAWEQGKFEMCLDILCQEDLEQAGCTPRLARAIREGTWPECVSARYHNPALRWTSAARRYGPQLAASPRVKLATIHGAKGAEGSTVILSTQTSRRIEQSRRRVPEKHDEECRIAYVGVTRARRRLIVVQSPDSQRMELPL
jgi:superfamily I DNA/RNA helicase